MIICIPKRLAGQLHPRMGRELPVPAADAHSHKGSRDPAICQHLRKSYRSDQALRAENSKTRCPNHRQRQSSSFG